MSAADCRDAGGPVQLGPPLGAGTFVVIEGTDGAGKTTLVKGLTAALAARELDVCSTFQPSAAIRATPAFHAFAESADASEREFQAFYMMTVGDRLFHVLRTVEPVLRRGGVVVCDRYVYTTLANIEARRHTVEPWLRAACAHLPTPDVAVLVHCPLAVALERIRRRPEENARPIDLQHMAGVRDGFLKQATTGHLRAIDTSAVDESATLRQVFDWVDAAVSAEPRA